MDRIKGLGLWHVPCMSCSGAEPWRKVAEIYMEIGKGHMQNTPENFSNQKTAPVSRPGQMFDENNATRSGLSNRQEGGENLKEDLDAVQAGETGASSEGEGQRRFQNHTERQKALNEEPASADLSMKATKTAAGDAPNSLQPDVSKKSIPKTTTEKKEAQAKEFEEQPSSEGAARESIIKHAGTDSEAEKKRHRPLS